MPSNGSRSYGGSTKHPHAMDEVEVKERKDGIVALDRYCLGGVQHAAARYNAFLDRRADGVKGVVDDEDQDAGINLVRKALQSPIRQIAENACVEGSIVVVGRVMDERSAAFGYDAQAGEYGDMFERGIIDPAKIIHIALQVAASLAG